MLSKTKNAVIYARYSSEKQSGGSIEDQVRNCIQLAEYHGYQVNPEDIFHDAAVTGQKSGVTKRVGFKEMFERVERGDIHCVVLDELSRAGRDKLELFLFIASLKNVGVRLLVKSSGLDSAEKSFEWTSLISIGLASHELELIKERTTRGLWGALQKGGMTGYPPLGYQLGPKVQADDRTVRTFIIDEEKRQLVIDIFEMRAKGYSFYQIASELNDQSIPTPRKPMEGNLLGGFWRANTVKQIVKNTLYRGAFTYHGSRQAQKEAQVAGRPLEKKEYPRPGLRIISDELWYRVQPTEKADCRKGFTNRYTHRVRCLFCKNICTVKVSATTTTLGCGVCLQAQRTDKKRSYRRAYEVSIRALDAVLQDVFDRLKIEGVLETYESQLMKLVNSEHDAELEAINRRLRDLEIRLSILLSSVIKGEGDPSELKKSHESMTQEKARLTIRRDSLSTKVAKVSFSAVKAHLKSLEPDWFLTELFKGSLDARQCNEIIRAIFESIYYRKIDRNNSTWCVTVNLHELRLPQSGSQNLQGKVKFEYDVFCKRATPVSYIPTYRGHTFLEE